MKKIYLHIALALGLGSVVFTSCDDFLDTTPDDRTEIDTADKARQILVAAYPTNSGNMAMEWSSDNVIDNGDAYANPGRNMDQIYSWTKDTSTGNDSPKSFWNACYSAIANANQALDALKGMEETSDVLAIKGEALLCRAFAHFLLSQNFCLAYNPETAATDLGLPYAIKPETEVAPQYSRGTMEELYGHINKDIEEGLPLIKDAIYTVPKYHFNKAAAYAFATRFNLYYTNYDKAIQYASEVLTDNPSAVLRDWASWLELPKTFNAMWDGYIDADLPNNLMFLLPNSSQGRYISYGGYCEQYAHSKALSYIVGPRAPFIWEEYSRLIKAKYSGSNNQRIGYVCMPEKFEYTDKAAGIGYVHTVLIPFTTNKTLLERAEAYALNNEIDNAVADINAWMKSSLTTQAQYTKQEILDYITPIAYTKYPATSLDDLTVKNELHPQGFTVNSGEQEEIIQFILYLKRVETIHEGGRWMDIKRYGIEVSHMVEDDPANPLLLPVGSPKRALQLPADVITAGLQANPE